MSFMYYSWCIRNTPGGLRNELVIKEGAPRAYSSSVKCSPIKRLLPTLRDSSMPAE